jgi:hypothetical protein
MAAFAQLSVAVQEDLYAAATARLRAQGVQPAFCIRPVVLAEVYRSLQDAPRLTLPDAPPPWPQAAAPPASPPRAAVLGPPTLRDVTLEDLCDVGRVLALRTQAQARGWVTGSEADQLHVVAAAVHARRVGQEPCALFVALVRTRRWEVLTEGDEDTARGWLRDALDGPAHRAVPAAPAPTAAPPVPLSDDACVIDRVQRVRPRARQDTPCLAVKLQGPDWTPARWALAQAELTQWRLQQALATAPAGPTRLRELGEVDVPWELDPEEDG